MFHFRFFFYVLALLALAVSATSAWANPPQRPRVVAYVPNWIDLPAFAATLDYAKVTHLNLAFENPVNDAGDLSFHEQDAALLAQAAAHGVPVLISIGGALSNDPPLPARYEGLLADSAHRAAFVGKLTRYVSAHGFAGVDVDLEGPCITPSYGAFIADLAAALQPQGKLLTAAFAEANGGDRVPPAALARFDFVNIMAYDATGPWRPAVAGQHSSMEFAAGSVRYWLGRGLPKDKAVLGVPFYGYGFGEAFRSNPYPYREIVEKFPGAEKLDQIGDTIWYNGVPTTRAKAAYARAQGLGGIMIWSLNSDAPGPRSLLDAIHDGWPASAR